MPKQGRLFEAGTSLPKETETSTRYRLVLVREGEDLYTGSAICREPRIVAGLLHPLVRDEPREIFGALLLDGRNRAIGHTVPYAGTLNTAVVEPRGVFVPALLSNARSLILFHNHPSGDPAPSPEDRKITEQMMEAGRILGVRVLDHIILGEAPSFFSLREAGLCENP